MYLQITLRCNFTCDHCCFSCNKSGKHGDYENIIDGIAFARDHTEMITIGGGEPTLHPRFFDILRYCLNDFDYVWMATNGSKTKSMRRLANIIDGCDYESFDCSCTEDELEMYVCNCHDNDVIYQEEKLTVALSQDYFHDGIDTKISSLWRKRTEARRQGYEIRDVTRSMDGISSQGRAKKNGYTGRHCVCSDIIIKPDGKLRMCGCNNAPDHWSCQNWDRGQVAEVHGQG